MQPLVSILIPCFNAEKWIGQAIESALAQTWAEKEVILVDDGSSDGSLAIIKSFGDRIRFETGPNRGGNVARNRLLDLARGDWLQYLDADDFLLPNKVTDQMEFVKQNPHADIVFSRVIQESRTTGTVRQSVAGEPPALDPWILLVLWELPQTGAVLYRKEAVTSVGGWKVDQPCCQEHELYLRLLLNDRKFVYSSSVGAVYRQWSYGSVSTRDIAQVCQRRLEIVKQAEDFLRKSERLMPARLWAINHARFEVARLLWRFDRESAVKTASLIRESQPQFVPGGPYARIRYSAKYRLGYRLLGFRHLETLADRFRIFAIRRRDGKLSEVIAGPGVPWSGF